MSTCTAISRMLFIAYVLTGVGIDKMSGRLKSACLTLLALSLFLPHLSYGQVVLESPQPGQTLTGVGLVSGWACEAEEITVRLQEGAAIEPVPYGGSRNDTIPTCQDDGLNSFSLLVNWNRLGVGTHTMTLFVDGRSVVSREFTVVTYGEEFMQGVEKTWTITDWPERGTDTILRWNEAKQNIEIADIRQPDPVATAPLEDLLGSWRFGTQEHGADRHFFTLTGIDPDPLDRHAFGHLDYSSVGARVYGEANETRWFSQTLRQYEVYWLTGTQCHMYVFSVYKPTGTATGYYWYGYGSEWEECFRDAHGPYTAVGARN